jgi:hypothetical protein
MRRGTSRRTDTIFGFDRNTDTGFTTITRCRESSGWSCGAFATLPNNLVPSSIRMAACTSSGGFAIVGSSSVLVAPNGDTPPNPENPSTFVRSSTSGVPPGDAYYFERTGRLIIARQRAMRARQA